MTLILTHASKFSVCQTSDRLITSDGKAVDTVSNKTVIMVSGDEAYVMSYTGAAFLEGVPTDQRIAEILIEQRMTIGGRTPAYGGWQEDIDLSYRPCLRRLRDKLTSAFVRASKAQRSMIFSLCITGFEVVNGRFTPIFDKIHKKIKSAECNIIRNRDVVRSRGLNTAFDHSPGIHLGDSVSQVLSSMSRSSFSGTRPSEDQIVKEFVGATRVASSRANTVGSHCMAVMIETQPVKKIRIEFIPSAMHAMHMADVNQIVPLSYSPIIIHPNGFIHASSMSGLAPTMKIKGWEIEFSGIPQSGDVLMYLAGQRRPKPC